jgi:hypothetical protein
VGRERRGKRPIFLEGEVLLNRKSICKFTDALENLRNTAMAVSIVDFFLNNDCKAEASWRKTAYGMLSIKN